MTREGYIEKIIYKNEENGYTVMSVEGDNGDEIFVGTLFGAAEGLYIIAEGDFVNHPQYDVQFKFTACEVKIPEDSTGIERYLASGIIKGIGEVLAKRIVKKFKTETLNIIEYEPERLAEINGISERKARKIASSYAEKKEFQGVVMFLSEYGISVNLAIKIYNEYGDKIYDIVRQNPYKIAEDVSGVGFKMADAIALKMGMAEDSEYRLRSAILYVLTLSNREGHMYLPKTMLLEKVYSLVYEEDGYNMDSVYREEVMEMINDQLLALAIESHVIVKHSEEDAEIIYLASNYYIELGIARMLTDLQLTYDFSENEIDAEIGKIEKEDIVLDAVQKNAVKSAITSGVVVITGGPGTGKTTIINTIIKYYSKHGMDIALCAPTGRAAKRMEESTGYPAQTIHRLLEISGNIDESGDSRVSFQRNSSNPLEYDAIIVDEMSMADCFIFNSLLQAVMYGTRLILVGDYYQLPSVGPGNILRDIIKSDCFPVTTLTNIYRQESGSDIVYNAHRINKGEHLEISNKSKDFFYIPKKTSEQIIGEVKELISDNLPKYLGIKPMDIQVLTPMRKYDTGAENMNVKLQDILNPKTSGKMEYQKSDITFRVGDKVMQIKNNYKLMWKQYDIDDDSMRAGYAIAEGTGVFNGDVGIVTDINDFDEELTVFFDDGKEVVYEYALLDELEHAFAVTVHKSQGSEYPAVIIPILTGPRKLLNRNLLYTAITRAKRMVVLVGNIGLINQMIDNKEENKRFTTLDIRLQEIKDVESFSAERG